MVEVAGRRLCIYEVERLRSHHQVVDNQVLLGNIRVELQQSIVEVPGSAIGKDSFEDLKIYTRHVWYSYVDGNGIQDTGRAE